MSDRDVHIRDLAYRIWEEAGRPHGEDERHWDEAQRRYAAAATAETPLSDEDAAKAAAKAVSRARKRARLAAEKAAAAAGEVPPPPVEKPKKKKPKPKV